MQLITDTGTGIRSTGNPARTTDMAPYGRRTHYASGTPTPSAMLTGEQ